MDWATGDPAGMRSVASELQKYEARLRNCAKDLALSLEDVQFEGPFASRTRLTVKKNRTQTLGAAGRIGALAEYLIQAAAKVEAEQYRIEQLRLKREREAEDRRERERMKNRGR